MLREMSLSRNDRDVDAMFAVLLEDDGCDADGDDDVDGRTGGRRVGRWEGQWDIRAGGRAYGRAAGRPGGQQTSINQCGSVRGKQTDGRAADLSDKRSDGGPMG